MLGRRAARGHTVLFSSHQLDLVQSLCSSIVMLHRGRVALQGPVAELRARAGRRQLRISTTAAADRWLGGFETVRVIECSGDAVTLDVPDGVDALAVLDAARALGPVTDFGLDLPTLSQVFLTAAAALGEEHP